LLYRQSSEQLVTITPKIMRSSFCTLLFFFRLSSLRADTSGGDNVGTSHGYDDYHNRLRGSFRRLEDETGGTPMTWESFDNDCKTQLLSGEENLNDKMITAPEYAKFIADACVSSGGKCAKDGPFSTLNLKLQVLFLNTYLHMECKKGEVSEEVYTKCKEDKKINLEFGTNFVFQIVIDHNDKASVARILKLCKGMWENAEPYVVKMATPAPTTSRLPTERQSNNPSTSSQPSLTPSKIPSSTPTIQPSILPSTNPSINSSTQPSLFPSNDPSNFPSSQFSYSPSNSPSSYPTNIVIVSRASKGDNKRSNLLGKEGPVVITGATVLGSAVLVAIYFASRRLCQQDGDKVQPALEPHNDFISGNSIVVPNTKLTSELRDRQNEECPITQYIAFEKNCSDDECSLELLSVASSRNDLVADIDSVVNRNDWDAMAKMAGDTNTEDGNSSGDSIIYHTSNSSLMMTGSLVLKSPLKNTGVNREHYQRHSLLSVASTEYDNQSGTDGNSIHDLLKNNGHSHQGSLPLTEESLTPEIYKTNSTSAESKSPGPSLITIASANFNSPPSENQVDSFKLNSKISEQDSSIEKDFDYLVNNSPERVKLHHNRSTPTKNNSISKNLELEKFGETDKSNSFENNEKHSYSTDSSMNILHEGEDSFSLNDTLDQAIEIKHNDLLENKRESNINDLETINPENKPLNVNYDNSYHEDKFDELLSNQSGSLTTKSSDGNGQGLISYTSDSVSSNGWSSGVMSDTLSDTLSVINDDENDVNHNNDESDEDEIENDVSDHNDDEIDEDEMDFLEHMIEEDDFQGVRTWKKKKREAETSKRKIFTWRDSIMTDIDQG